ncbi:hypothetical protein JHK86_031980 [Glycine max]|nr:hypothetical protein JHK86_031980 [Glycine max]
MVVQVQHNLLLVITFLMLLWSWWSLLGALGDPQTHLINKGCSQYNATDLSNFNQNLNATLDDLRAQVSNQSKHFATAQEARGADPVYAMFQCRNYLSTADCAACFVVATAQIRNCSAGANGARVIYDGCFLRYESNGFFDQTTLAGNSMICGNQTAVGATTSFNTTAQQVLMELQIATPKITGFFAATKTQLAGGGAIYAIAQCAETATESACLDCLTVGYNNIHICLPNTDGRAFDAGCFMRYSETAFFADNQTIDITPFLKQGGSSNKKGAIIGGVVGGVGLVVILLALFGLLRRYKKPKRVPRGDILGATELKGPVPYRYKDLKTATKNFSDENKLGEGGFGDVYKGTLKNGKIVAVKKLILGQSGKMDEQFESEVKLISNVHHKNLVRLLGCCSKGENKGSLNWKQRYDIILGTAKGLAYLHEDFHAWKLYVQDMHLELVDKTLLDPEDYDAEEVKKIIEIALLCTQASAAARPTMSEIVAFLKSKNSLGQIRPSMPVFVETNLRTRAETSTSTGSSTSNATASISMLSAR